MLLTFVLFFFKIPNGYTFCDSFRENCTQNKKINSLEISGLFVMKLV